MRVGGVDDYDAWTAGDLGFQSEAVSEAARMADAIIFGPGFVHGGTATISRDFYRLPVEAMVKMDDTVEWTEPECWMFHQSDLMLQTTSSTGKVAGTSGLDFFVLPPIDPSQPTPAIGGATFASALVDRPEVKAFMQFIADPEWGERWADDPASDFTSPNQRFDMSAYAAGDPDARGGFPAKVAAAAHAALAADLFRLDASDLMPAEIGLVTQGDDGKFVAGAFFRGMLDWVDQTRSIDQVLADIDAEWATLKAIRETPPPST